MDELADMAAEGEQPSLSDSDDDVEDTVPSKRQKVSDSESKDDDSGDSDEESGDQEGSAEDQGNAPEIDPEDELRAFKDADASSKEWKNRQRVLLVTQRSIEGQF